MSSALETLIAALHRKESARSGNQWTCPVHKDTKPSLSVTEGDDGRVLVHCHAGCATEDIVAALGLTMADLFESNGGRQLGSGFKIIATHDYVSEDGSLLSQVCRLEPKGFWQRRPDGNGGWIWNLDGTRKVLYRLPKVLDAAQAGQVIYVVEGEKDVHAVEEAGGVATCNPGGAGKWREEYSKSLVGAHCRVVADDDDSGRKHACAVADSLRAAGVSVELLLPARGNDAADHLERGLDLDDFVPFPEEEVSSGADVRSEEFHRSDMGNAHLFARMHGQDVRFDHGQRRWLVWTEHRWAPDADGRLVRMAEDVARKRFGDAWELSDKDEAKKAAKFAIGSENRQRVIAMLELARSQLPIADSGENWDPNPMLLGVPNGVVDLRNGELRNGRRDDRISMWAGVPYDPKAVCNRWLRFLCEVFDENEDLIDFVQRAVGYSLTGGMSEQCLFLLHGVGANGKTTFLNAVRCVVRDYGYNMPFSTVEMNQRSSVPNDLAALVGRRLVTSSETNEATRLNEGRVKALTGGDPITARFLHKEFFSFQPVAKFWLAVNHKPRVTDDSHGFWRRVRLIPFLRQFPGDKHLEAQLKAEAPAILQWAVQGCLLWQERGLDPPELVLTATEEYRQESDLLEAFIAECIEVADDGSELPVREIVKAYEGWADREGLKKRERLGRRSLQSRLKARWPERHRAAVRRTPTRYVGLQLAGSDV